MLRTVYPFLGIVTTLNECVQHTRTPLSFESSSTGAHASYTRSVSVQIPLIEPSQAILAEEYLLAEVSWNG